MEEKCAQGYARVVCYGDIKNKRPKNLKIFPVAMIPHKSKPYYCILDLSFVFKLLGITYPSINESTTPLVPPEAMVQLGHAINRIISHMTTHYDKERPFHFTKLDIKDFLRLKLVMKTHDIFAMSYPQTSHSRLWTIVK